MSLIASLFGLAAAFGAEHDYALLAQVGVSELNGHEPFGLHPAFELGYRSSRWTPGRRTATSFEVAAGLDFPNDVPMDMLGPIVPIGHLAWGLGTSREAPAYAEFTVGVLIFLVVPVPEVGLRVATPIARDLTGARLEVGAFARAATIPCGGPCLVRWVVGSEARVVLGHRSR